MARHELDRRRVPARGVLTVSSSGRPRPRRAAAPRRAADLRGQGAQGHDADAEEPVGKGAVPSEPERRVWQCGAHGSSGRAQRTHCHAHACCTPPSASRQLVKVAEEHSGPGLPCPLHDCNACMRCLQHEPLEGPHSLHLVVRTPQPAAPAASQPPAASTRRTTGAATSSAAAGTTSQEQQQPQQQQPAAEASHGRDGSTRPPTTAAEPLQEGSTASTNGWSHGAAVPQEVRLTWLLRCPASCLHGMPACLLSRQCDEHTLS
eukprot:366082-Chlamydomonas_euryale.AAC.25